MAGARVLVNARGRGNQMNAGAAVARGEVLLFVHADTRLPGGFRAALAEVLASEGAVWGRFDLRFDHAGPLLALIARLISLRSRVFHSATCDQAIFVRRGVFEAVGGYREPLLFEDVDLVRRQRPCGGMVVPRGYAVTSSRRWRNRGILRTTLAMWALKSLYLVGVSSRRLIRYYSDER
ncbi:MAG: glycosyltransferase family 2 protein [Deltaproteobacteria bacterium]|nr:glycosyltransferase family 2 protein [Deltaproteobacteria bacterium]